MPQVIFRRGLGTPLDYSADYSGDYSGEPDTGIFQDISSIASSGAGGLGQASQFLLRAGYTVEAVRNAFNNIAAVGGASTPELELATQELRYLNNNPAAGLQTRSNTGAIVGVGVVVLLLWLASRSKN